MPLKPGLGRGFACLGSARTCVRLLPPPLLQYAQDCVGGFLMTCTTFPQQTTDGGNGIDAELVSF